MHNDQIPIGANALPPKVLSKPKIPKSKSKPQSQIEAELTDLNKELVKDDPTDLFTIIKEIGKGASGSVHAAVAKNKQVYAIKKVPLTLKTLAATNKEIKFMKRIEHPNTLSYYWFTKKESLGQLK